MQRRQFNKLISLLPLLSGCGYARINPYHFMIRSESLDSFDKEQRVVDKARLDWTSDGRIRVLYLQGDPYERGYQHGKLLRNEVRDNLGYLWREALKKFHSEELFVEAFERMRPHISEEYLDEMHGLAHGSEMPLNVIHYIHALPEIGEWGGKKRLKGIVKEMIDGTFGTSCSNLSAVDSATPDRRLYTVRILDWGLHRISKLHQYPLIAVSRPTNGLAYANIGWVGFLGAISGINESGITLGEMGYGAPPNETLSGQPMSLLLRDILSKAASLSDVRRIIGQSPGTNSYIFVMSDGKTGKAELYVKDHDRFMVVQPGQRMQEGGHDLPGIKDMVYGGHLDEQMAEILQRYPGQISPELLMREVVPQLAMKSNFQNVIYDPAELAFWVSNAKSKDERAAEQPYTYFSLKDALSGSAW